MTKLRWHGKLPDNNMDQVELEVIKDIQYSLWGLEKPSDLIFHTVFLSKDKDHPSVLVWGESDDDDHLHCEYHEETQLVTISNMENDDD